MRTFVFRIYPSPEQAQRLLQWEGACRALWNCAHQQILMALLAGRRVPSSVDQQRELTDLRAAFDWMNDVPRHVAQVVLDRLGEAWSRCFARQGGRPGFRAKGRDPMSLEEFDPRVFRLDTAKSLLRFPKLGSLPIVLHQPVHGQVKTCELVRDVDQWFAHLTVEREDEGWVHEKGPVALDLGVRMALADSDGTLVANPRFGALAAPKITKLQRTLARKTKGSNNRRKAREKLARAQRQLRRQREHFQHTQSHRYAKNHSVIVMEDLRVKNLTASARGTTEEPGTWVRQKAGLNRALLDVAPSRFRQLVAYKTRRFGGALVLVAASYSSQTCARCQHVDAASRQGAIFRCTGCGHGDHADVNAAKVLLQRYKQELSTRRTGGDEVCGGDGVARPTKQKPKAVRSRTPRSNAGAKSPVVHGGDGLR